MRWGRLSRDTTRILIVSREGKDVRRVGEKEIPVTLAGLDRYELMTGDISSVFFSKLSEPVRGITIFAGGTNGRRSLFLKASYKSAWRTRQPLRFDRYTSRQPLEESS